MLTVRHSNREEPWLERSEREEEKPDRKPFQCDWIKTILYEVRDCAICDLVKAYENYFWGVTTKSHLDFRTKKDKQQSIVV